MELGSIQFGIGEVFALSCAFVWACDVMCFKHVGDRLPPFELNLFKNIIGATGFLIILLFTTNLDLSSLRGSHVLALAASGIVGITIADSMLLASLNLLGAGRMAIIDCLYTPFMILGSYLFIRDPLTIWHGIGATLVLTGVLIAAVDPAESKASFASKENRLGLALGAGSMLLMAFCITSVDHVMNVIPLEVFIEIRLLAAVIAAILWLAFRKRLRSSIRLMTSRSLPWPTLIIGSFLGAFLGMWLWIAGFKYTETSTAAILNQSSLIFILIFAAILFREKFTLRKTLGASIAFIGICITSLLG